MGGIYVHVFVCYVHNHVIQNIITAGNELDSVATCLKNYQAYNNTCI